MATATIQDKLIDYLQDTHAMEQNVLRMLDGMIAQTTQPEALTQLRVHRLATERHERLVRERLEALGSGPSVLTDVPAIAGAWMKGLVDMLRSDKPGKMARDAYITEHVEIAAYALLERLAERAGDLQTTRLARDLGADERQMADWIEDHWDLFVDLTLEQAGIESVWESGGAAPRTTRPAAFTQRLAAGTPRVAATAGTSAMTTAACVAGLGVAGFLLYELTRGTSRPASHPTAGARCASPWM
jgi:ferritin-like metal-binding protein YciE